MFYYALLTHLFSVLLIARNSSKRYDVVVVGVLVFLGALLPSLLYLTDFPNYLTYFSKRFYNPSPYGLMDFEPGYYYLNKLWWSIGGSFYELRFLMLAFVFGAKVWLLRRYSSNWWIGVLFYVALLYFPDSYLIRSSLAGSFLVISTFFIFENRKAWAVFYIVLAVSFHYSAICFLLAFSLSFFRLSKTVYTILIIAILILAVLNISISIFQLAADISGFEVFQVKAELYVENGQQSEIGILKGSIILYVIVFFLHLFFTDYNDRVIQITGSLMVCGLFFLLVFADSQIFSERFFRLFAFSFPLAFCQIFSSKFLKSRKEIVAVSAIAILNVACYITTTNDVPLLNL